MTPAGYVVALEAPTTRIGIWDEVFDTITEAQAFIDNPPEAWRPRPQDHFTIYAIEQGPGVTTV